MTQSLFILSLTAVFALCACAQPEPQDISNDAKTVELGFTKSELNGLVMVTQGVLDGRLESTGELKDGATLLIFEKDYAWAFGETSPENLQGKHTIFSWKLNKQGQVILRGIPDQPDFAPRPSTCTLTKIKEHKREFTQGGLAEKIDTVFDCNTYPKDSQYEQTFLLPMPLFAHMLVGNQTYFSNTPDAISTFQQDRTRKRPDPMQPGKDVFLYDPFKSGNYHHSITISHTDKVYTNDGETTREIGKHRLLMFEHGTIRHSTMLDLSYSPIIYTPPGDDGYARQSIDRYELHSIYRIKNLTYNPIIGKNYNDKPSDIARSVNANLPPLKSALVFK